MVKDQSHHPNGFREDDGECMENPVRGTGTLVEDMCGISEDALDQRSLLLQTHLPERGRNSGFIRKVSHVYNLSRKGSDRPDNPKKDRTGHNLLFYTFESPYYD